MSEKPREILSRSFASLKRQTDYWCVDFSAVAEIRECLAMSVKSGSGLQASSAIAQSLHSMLGFCAEAVDSEVFTCRFFALSAVITAVLPVTKEVGDQLGKVLTVDLKKLLVERKEVAAIIQMHIKAWSEFADSLKPFVNSTGKIPKFKGLDLNWVDLWTRVASGRDHDLLPTLIPSSVRILCRAKSFREACAKLDSSTHAGRQVYQLLIRSLVCHWSSLLNPFVAELDSQSQSIGSTAELKASLLGRLAIRLRAMVSEHTLENSILVWLVNSAPLALRSEPLLIIIQLALHKSDSFRDNANRLLLAKSLEERPTDLEPLNEIIKKGRESSWESSLSHQLKPSALILAADAQFLTSVSDKYLNFAPADELRYLIDVIKAQTVLQQNLLLRFQQIREEQLKAGDLEEAHKVVDVAFAEPPALTSSTEAKQDIVTAHLSRRLQSTMDKLHRAFSPLQQGR